MLRAMAILRERQVWRKHPAAPPKRYKLTPEEQARVKLAMHVLRVRLGGWAEVAAATGYTYKAVTLASSPRVKVSGSMALRVAGAAGMPLEAMLAGCCPMCGRSG
jgi:hypothetical protein